MGEPENFAEEPRHSCTYRATSSVICGRHRLHKSRRLRRRLVEVVNQLEVPAGPPCLPIKNVLLSYYVRVEPHFLGVSHRLPAWGHQKVMTSRELLTLGALLVSVVSVVAQAGEFTLQSHWTLLWTQPCAQSSRPCAGSNSSTTAPPPPQLKLLDLVKEQTFEHHTGREFAAIYNVTDATNSSTNTGPSTERAGKVPRNDKYVSADYCNIKPE